jgi:Ca2+-binding EF-hand superfamily protein
MDFMEFVKLMMTQNQFMMDDKDLKEAFRMFDRDGRGYVMSSDLRTVLRHLEDNIPEHEINEILQDHKQSWNRKIIFDGKTITFQKNNPLIILIIVTA